MAKLTDSHKSMLGHAAVIVACSGIVWLIVDALYNQSGYAAPVPEIRYNHDCAEPPAFLIRALSETGRPADLAMYVRVENFADIASGCSFIDLFLIPQGSRAITTENWAARLSEQAFFRVADGRGFAMRLSPDGSGQRAETIAVPEVVHKRSIDRWFFWLHFGPVWQQANSAGAELQFEYQRSDRFLIEDLTLRGTREGTVFGDSVEARLSDGEGLMVDLLDSTGKYHFALLNVIIGVLVSIGTASLVSLCGRILSALAEQ